MLIPLDEVVRKHGLNIKGVLQIGAHFGEEHDTYIRLGIKNIVYVEPCKPAYNKLLERFKDGSEADILIWNVACGEEYGEMEMFVSHNNEGQSNSLLKPKLHLQQHPEVVFTDKEKVLVVPLDSLDIDMSKYNMLMMDVQGAEGLVLKGARETLKHIDIIYTEVNNGATYEGNMETDEMDAFLKEYGFVRVETLWASKNWTWGDAVYVKKLPL